MSPSDNALDSTLRPEQHSLRDVELIATDLDGTLLRTDDSISPRTKAQLNAAQSDGITVVIATGRPPRWMPSVLERMDYRGIALLANGAVILDAATDEIVATHPIALPTAYTVVQQLRDNIPGIAFAGERVRPGRSIRALREDPSQAMLEHGPADEFLIEPHYELVYDIPMSHSPIPAEEMIARGDIVKILARLPESASPYTDVVLEEMRQMFPRTLIEITRSFSQQPIVEFSAPTASKGAALADLARRQGLGAHQVAAVGDMPNDISMLSWAAGAAAVSNAHSLVHDVANISLPSNDEDGVALLIEHARVRQLDELRHK